MRYASVKLKQLQEKYHWKVELKKKAIDNHEGHTMPYMNKTVTYTILRTEHAEEYICYGRPFEYVCCVFVSIDDREDA